MMHLFALRLIFLHPCNALFFVAQCHDGFVECVKSDRLCKSSVFGSLVFLLFSLEVISSAFVLPLAAVLIVEVFVFVFCFAS